ncbi:MAG: hypothetical protein Q8L41_04240 [Anaerolineales bacterium]|nr:hypothetical protein [Anaerolineales bacterium]
MKSRPYLLEVQSGGNGADIAGVVAFLAFAGYISFMIYLFLPMVGNIPFFSKVDTAIEKAELLSYVTPTSNYPAGYAGVSIGDGAPVLVTPEAVQIQSTYTPYPTYTPFPTVNAFPLSNHRFSFYDPMIGKDKPDIALINCENWNFATQYCDSKLRNGERWEDNYFLAAACPYDLYLAGAFFEVVSPDWLKALFPRGFTCKDTGEMVMDLFIDFLIPWGSMPMPYDQTPWGDPITLMRLR